MAAVEAVETLGGFNTIKTCNPVEAFSTVEVVDTAEERHMKKLIKYKN